MNVAVLAIALLAALAPGEPEVQRPTVLDAGSTAPDSDAAEPDPVESGTTEPESTLDSAGDADAESESDSTTPVELDAAEDVAPADVRPGDDEVFTVAAGRAEGAPPFYDAADEAALRKRYAIEVPPETPPRKAKWRCLIADPTCGTSFEVNATSAYAYRTRQGDVRRQEDLRWHSGRVQYDFWLNLPMMVETLGKQRFTRMTMGPKGGVIFSDTGALWGNLGFAARYWLGRGRFAPTVEFSSALSYRIGGRPTQDLGGEDPKFKMTRGPVGFTGDVGVGMGGFGAIILGGQYDSPLAREDVPERFRVSAGGMFFLGFRGNIAWGAPAGAAAVTHGLTQRLAKEP